MKIRFGKNDVVDTKLATEDIDALYDEVNATNLEENTEPNLNMLLLKCLHNQAIAMSGEEGAATVLALTGMERNALIAYLEERIASFSAE